MAYTFYGEEVDNYIENNYLNKIIKSFIKDCKNFDCNLISVILFGGFGKGEGSIQFINNKPIPYNDFDFYIVSDRKLNNEELNKISMNASKAIGMGGLEIAYFPEQGYNEKKFFHIDVRCIPYNKLNKLMSIQRYYELKYGSKVIYGERVLDKMNVINSEDIPSSDGLRNLFNRFHQMLLGLYQEYNEDQRKIKIFWSFKCYLSICEALLILDKNFKSTSKERTKLFSEIYEKNFPELYEIIPTLAEKVKIATNFKLKPFFNVDHNKLFNTALKDLLIVFEYYIKKMTNSSDIEHAINKKLPYIYFKPFLEEKIGFNFFPVQYFLNFVYFNALRNNNELYFKPLLNWKDVGLKMVLPIYYLLKSYQEIYNKLNENKILNNNLKKDIGFGKNPVLEDSGSENGSENLNKAFLELKKLIKIDEKEKNNFWYLRERALKAFGLYYQQRLL